MNMDEPADGTQNARLLDYLREGRSIDPLTSWTQLGIYRLGARVFDLRQAGYNIVSSRKAVRNRFGESISVASYKLEQ
jgi:hypothetical protein